MDAGLIVFMYNNRDSGAKDHVLDRNNITTPPRSKLRVTLSVVRLAHIARLYAGVKTRESQAKSSFPTRGPKLEHRLHIASKPVQQFVALNPQMRSSMQLWLLNDTILVCSSAPHKVSSIWKPIFPKKHQKAIANVENLSLRKGVAAVLSGRLPTARKYSSTADLPYSFMERTVIQNP